MSSLDIEQNHYEFHLFIHRKQLRPVIIQCTSYEYKKKDKYRQK